MKAIIALCLTLGLTACGALDSGGKCFFAQKPSMYLVNEQGKYINLEGKIVSQPVVNPYYLQFIQCYGNDK